MQFSLAERRCAHEHFVIGRCVAAAACARRVVQQALEHANALCQSRGGLGTATAACELLLPGGVIRNTLHPRAGLGKGRGQADGQCAAGNAQRRYQALTQREPSGSGAMQSSGRQAGDKGRCLLATP